MTARRRGARLMAVVALGLVLAAALFACRSNDRTAPRRQVLPTVVSAGRPSVTVSPAAEASDVRSPAVTPATATKFGKRPGVTGESPPKPTPRVETLSIAPINTNCHAQREWFRLTTGIFVEWSPDGREVYFSQGPELFAVTADGSTVRRVARAWARAGLQDVARATPYAERNWITPTPVDPPVPGRVTPGVGTTIPFDVSPDGARVVFVSCAYPHPGALDVEWEEFLVYGSKAEFYAYDYELALADTGDGRSWRLTTTRDIAEGAPSWSPDGEWIAFATAPGDGASEERSERELLVMAADGSAARPIVRASRRGLPQQAPAWSPDGTRLAFVGRHSAGTVLLVVDATGRQPQPLEDLQRIAYTLSEPAWSPDGRQLVYSRVERDYNVGVYTSAPDGSDAQRVAKITGWDWDFRAVDFLAIGSVAWSPDGSKILFTVNPYRRYGRALAVHVVNADGTGGTPMAWRWPEDFEPRAGAWAPDGTRLAIVAEWVPNKESYAPFSVRPVVVLSMAPDGTDIRVLAQGDPWPVDDYVPLPEMDALGPRLAAAVGDSASCATGGAIREPAANPGLVQDCEALLEFQRTLRGGESLNWSVAYPIHLWDGVALRDDPLRVSELLLAERQLAGVISPSIANLEELRVLSLRNNRLTGPIPAELGQLTKLETLHLHGNYLGGSVPTTLGELKNLRYLVLGENNLTGPLPEALGQLESLRALRIHDALISGPVPEFLGELTQLRSLDLAGNRLSGAIPPQLGQLDKLEKLDMSDNRLTGEIPGELGQLTNVEEVRLYGNQLTGCIPADLRPVAHQRFGSLGLPRCAPRR